MTHKQKQEELDVEKLRAQRDQYLAGWQRAQADYENLKKDMQKESAQAMEYARAKMMVDVLPVVDYFEEAVRHIPTDAREQDWVQGIMHIKKQLHDFLEAQEMKPVAVEGEVFDPHAHEAIQVVEQPDNADRIIHVVRQGYTMRDQLVRPAQVIVGK